MEKESGQIVLIIDDSLLICKQIRQALKELPVFICEAHDGQEAVEVMQQYQPDLVLLDVVLPDTDGYELFGKLRVVDQNDASILFLTSKDKDDDVVRGFSKGACDYVKKPFAQKELQFRINAHLQMKRQRDELNRQNQELISNMEKLNYMAFRDGLTGLYNRRYVVGDLMDDMKSHKKDDVCNVMILADIDDFKKVNDTYGHDAGDMALICVANILAQVCREHQVIRWGGEEFLIVLFEVTREEAFGISERIRKEIEGFQIFHGDQVFFCTITLGLHVFREELGIEENVNCADKALYEGKRSGKNRSIWYENH